MPHHALAVERGADEQHEVGAVDLVVHPAWPAFGGCGMDVLIDERVDTVLAQRVG
jgi:hypothetical protein